VMLEYDKEGLIEYAASIYSKQLSLGRALKGLDIYLDELAERYEHSRKCLSIGMTAASFSVVSLGSKIPYSSFLPSPDGGSDSDKDGLADYLEDCLGTDIWLADTDNDGLSDYDEVYRYLSDPLDRDTDNDGLTDGEEAQRGTDPNRNETIYLPIDNPFYSVDDDTDEDGISDIKEVSMGTNMLLQDTDHDGISDGSECELGLDPLSADTDGDGFDDLKDLYPLDPEKGEGGINFHDDEELLMIMYGAIAVGATVASFFGCSSCASIAIKATIQIIELYDMEMEERRKGIDE
ncbi:MAG: hypothetical protein JW825_06800, partial [Candidatus Methanofastidiosa archaeon]|nr:hypothetical protein [Candidatus Methanofastidiosa archaeon]